MLTVAAAGVATENINSVFLGIGNNTGSTRDPVSGGIMLTVAAARVATETALAIATTRQPIFSS